MNGLSLKEIYLLTIEEIETSDLYENLLDDCTDSEAAMVLLKQCNGAISLLAQRIKRNDFSDFSEAESNLLVSVFGAIEDFSILYSIAEVFE